MTLTVPAPSPAARTWRTSLTDCADYVALEVRRTLRDTGFVIMGIGMPMLMYLLFTNIGDGADRSWKTASMVGMAAYGALGSALTTGTGIAEDKTTGWLRQLRVTPMPPRAVVAGRALTGSVVVLPSIVVVLAAGGLVNGVRLAAWQWAAVAVLLWIGSLPFALLGLGNGYRLTAQTTGLANVACNIGLSVLGGLWFPTSAFPHWLSTISAYTPTNRYGQLAGAVSVGSAPSAGTVAILVGWLLAFGGYAVVAYRSAARTV